jgi:hypothetical protein
MTLREFINKWYYMKYIGKYLSAERLFPRECISNKRQSCNQHPQSKT